jgi:hypothetical protein
MGAGMKPKSDRQKLVERAAQAVAGDPEKIAAWRQAWVRVWKGPLARFLAERAKQRPAMKVYEAHHFEQVARKAMLQAIINGATIEEGEKAAMAAIGVKS